MKRIVIFFVLFTIVVFYFCKKLKAENQAFKTELSSITLRGKLLAEYDTVAWHSTDAVLATHPKAELGARYIAHKTGTGWVVDFGRLSATGDKFLVDYEASQAGGLTQFTIRSFDPIRIDTGWNLAAAHAIETALKDFHGANHPYNIAVLPAEHGRMYVYLYPAQVKADIYPLGADVRYCISPSGLDILKKRQMHKTIIEYSSTGSSREKEAAGYHSHVLSDVPEDTDVFLVLTRLPRVPEIVVTQHYMYTIGIDGKITVEARPEAK